MQKTKVILNILERAQLFEIDSKAVEVVNDYVYLGQVVTPDPKHEAEIIRRIRMGWSAFGRRSEIMNGSLPLSLMNKCMTAASYRYSPMGQKLGGSLNEFNLH